MEEGRVLNRADSLVLQSIQIDSSSSPAGSTFRELDDVFLQTQTRIWLGEVLKTRLDEDISITDILSDGILLFEVSKVIWKMLLTKFMKLRSSMAYFSKSATGKSIGRYMPYSNVDSFLKICQIMGLTGIDLFSPSDVVEKRDVRRVCMCIRALSKKAISKDLNIPDFDVVTYTVTMPKDMVKGIRKSLEQSNNRFSEDSAGCNTHSVSRSKHAQRNWGPTFAGQCDTYSEESDNTDGNFQVAGFGSPDSPASWGSTSWGGVSLLNSDIENSPRGSTLDLENFHTTQCVFQPNEQDDNGSYNGSCSPSPESKSSLDTYHLLKDIHRFTDTLPHRTHRSQLDCLMEVNGGMSCWNKEAARTSNTPEDKKIRVWPVNFDLQSYESHVGDFVDNSISKRNAVAQLGINSCDTDRDESMFSTYVEDGVSILHSGTDFHGSNSVNKSLYRGNRPFNGLGDGDVSLTACFPLGKPDISDNKDNLQGNVTIIGPSVQLRQHQERVRYPLLVNSSTMNIDKPHIDEVDSFNNLPTKGSKSIESHEIKSPEVSEFLTPDSMPASCFSESPVVSRDGDDLNYTYPAIDDLEILTTNIIGTNESTNENLIISPLVKDDFSTTVESTNEAMNGKDIELATKEQVCSSPDLYTMSIVTDHVISVTSSPCLHASENYSCNKSTCSENNGREAKTDRHLLHETMLESTQQSCKYCGEDVASCKETMAKENIAPEQGAYVGGSDHKPHRKRLLQSFVGGLSIFGAVLLLFHIRKSAGRENMKKPSVPSTQVSKMNNAEFFPKNREQKGKPGGIYPAENLKF